MTSRLLLTPRGNFWSFLVLLASCKGRRAVLAGYERGKEEGRLSDPAASDPDTVRYAVQVPSRLRCVVVSSNDVSADPAVLAKSLLVDAFGRVQESVSHVVDGLSVADVLWRPDPAANSIAWLLWHLTRVEDDHVADVGQVEQVWTAHGWWERLALPYAVRDHGYGHTAEQVSAFPPCDPALLVGYHDAVYARTLEILDAMTAPDFARIVDRRWNPPVTAAVRLVSVVDDIARHIGQAEYVRGLVQRAQESH